MAEYIDREQIRYHRERVLNRWSGSRHTDCDVSYKDIATSGEINNLHKADVIERSEYDKVVKASKARIENQKQNLIATRNAYFQIEQEDAELRSKVDKTKINIELMLEQEKQKDGTYTDVGKGIAIALGLINNEIGE